MQAKSGRKCWRVRLGKQVITGPSERSRFEIRSRKTGEKSFRGGQIAQSLIVPRKQTPRIAIGLNHTNTKARAIRNLMKKTEAGFPQTREKSVPIRFR